MKRNSNQKYDCIDKSINSKVKIPKLKSSEIADNTVFEPYPMLESVEI